MRLKKFNEFRSESTADAFILQTIEDLGMTYELDVKNDDGDDVVKAVIDNKVFYIWATDDDVDYANYNIQFLINGRIEDDLETTDLRYGIEECLNKKIY